MSDFGAFLLEVEDAFDLEITGLLITPHLPPRYTLQLPLRQEVLLLRPDGTEASLVSRIVHIHLYPLGSFLAITFPDSTKDDVPIGSKIMISREAKEVIVGDDEQAPYDPST